MSAKIKTVTQHIIDSYLLLGILEIHKNEEQFLSAKEIINYMRDYGADFENTYVSRYKKHVNDWTTYGNNEEIIKSSKKGKRGQKLINDIPYFNYKDFLASFLLLSQISIKDTLTLEEELINKRGEQPLSIITKLYLVIKNGQSVELVLLNGDNFYFKPNEFICEQNKWHIKGMKDYQEELVHIAEIKSVVY